MSFRLPTPVLIVLIALAFATLIGLGVWQLERNAWRNGLVAERNAQISGTPLSGDEARGLPPRDLDYRLVSLTGTWDHTHVMILANRARFATKGEQVVEPLLLAPGGPAVLVDRGWYPDGQRAEVLADLERTDVADSQGLARYVANIGGRQTAAGTWTQISPRDMGVTLPYPVLPWYVIEGSLLNEDAGRPATLPAQGFFAYTSPVPHMEYALTWFGLAAALAAIAIIRFVVAPRRIRARGAPPTEG